MKICVDRSATGGIDLDRYRRRDNVFNGMPDGKCRRNNELSGGK